MKVRNTSGRIKMALSSLLASQLLHESLTCAICKEPYKTPVLISVCSHNFCSICIRRYFAIKQECPICGVDASSGNLTPNRILETIWQHFNNFRSSLEKMFTKCKDNNLADPPIHPAVSQHTTGSQDSTMDMEQYKQPTVVSTSKCSGSVDKYTKPPTKDTSSEEDCILVENTPEFSLGVKEFFTQSQGFSVSSQQNPTNKTSNVSPESHGMFTNQPKTKPCADTTSCNDTRTAVTSPCATTSNPITNALNSGEATNKQTLMNTKSEDGCGNDKTLADCPVCGLSVAATLINSHLDGCLAREEKKNCLRQNTPKRLKRNCPTVTKLAYNLLSLRELRKKMKEIGLPTNGDKAELKKRHQEFLAKHQAEQDKVDPRRLSILVDELNREEIRRKHFESSPRKHPLNPFDLQSSDTDSQEHMMKHAEQYKHLEYIARKSLPAKRLKVAEDITDAQNNVDIPTTSNLKKNASLENDEFIPDSQSSRASSVDCLMIKNMSKSIEPAMPPSPELYVNANNCSKSTISSNLKDVVEADSQAEDIKQFIDASLSPV